MFYMHMDVEFIWFLALMLCLTWAIGESVERDTFPSQIMKYAVLVLRFKFNEIFPNAMSSSLRYSSSFLPFFCLAHLMALILIFLMELFESPIDSCIEF